MSYRPPVARYSLRHRVYVYATPYSTYMYYGPFRARPSLLPRAVVVICWLLSGVLRPACELIVPSSLRQSVPLLTGHQTHPSLLHDRPHKPMLIDQTMMRGDAGRTVEELPAQGRQASIRLLSACKKSASDGRQHRSPAGNRQRPVLGGGNKAVYYFSALTEEAGMAKTTRAFSHTHFLWATSSL